MAILWPCATRAQGNCCTPLYRLAVGCIDMIYYRHLAKRLAGVCQVSHYRARYPGRPAGWLHRRLVRPNRVTRNGLPTPISRENRGPPKQIGCTTVDMTKVSNSPRKGLMSSKRLCGSDSESSGSKVNYWFCGVKLSRKLSFNDDFSVAAVTSGFEVLFGANDGHGTFPSVAGRIVSGFTVCVLAQPCRFGIW